MDSKWRIASIREVAEVNPGRNSGLRGLDDSTEVTFVPMAAVDDVSGTIARPETRTYGEVRKGFTPFEDNDVIFAKITPCMQNGKAAVARGLSSGLGFGSTEFHVLRASADLLPEWLWLFLRQPAFLEEAQRHFRGTAGQQRVPTEFLETARIPVPPLDEQRRVIQRVHECLARVDEVRSLRNESNSLARALIRARMNELAGAGRWPLHRLAEVIVASQNGRSLRSNGDVGNGAVLTLSAVREPELDLSAVKAVRFDDELFEKYRVQRDDVFISRSNTRELVGLSTHVGSAPTERLIFPDLLIRLVPDLTKVRPRYLAYVLRFPSVRLQIQERATGSSQTMVKISGERLREVTIPVPDLPSQDAMVNELDEAFAACARLADDIHASDVRQLRAAVLHSAFGGALLG